MHLRFVTRVQFIAALAAISLLTYSVWIYPSLPVTSRLANVLSGTSKVVVVLGDSFSDTGKHVDAAATADIASNNERNSARWTEILCKELVCDTVLNFARSASDLSTYSGGVVVDNELYANTTSENKTSLALLPDLKEQIQEWIRYEHKSTSVDLDSEYVFAITLGFWDIWQYATLDLKSAQNAIAHSVFILFEQLDAIAESFDEPVSFVLPRLWDVSFTPRFMSLAHSQNSQSRKFSEQQHKLIYLVKYWNTVLSQYAENWKSSHIYLPDWNNWLLDQIRSVQMKQMGFFDSLGLGTQSPTFKDVRNPCSRLVVPMDTSDGSDVSMSVPSECEAPQDHLFWDDTQFSSVAHEQLGALAVELLSSNNSANAHAMTQASTSDENKGKATIALPRLAPSLAPGN
ncbi:uncharacterized protein PV09_07371 [Verruconis gallopava]|uniref:Uncharacterized protein n=1 Tax=Verruconis gallopava TaxID=253628 RepID=A0A0D1XFW9_9PEZI|nr:uncharacterized protein PV09_07371 [Verruconis gallopava]KIW01081.1 hypothetical protein PV09_07371 [Verruconis gallopava]